MKKERIKNIILIALVLSSLLLTGKIWLNEKLWPDGYNFFTQLEHRIFALFQPQAQEDARNILFPTHMIAYTVKNSDHASCMLTNTNENYVAVRSFCNSVIADALSQPAKNISVTDEAAWKNALFTNGMYLDYGADIPSDVFCAFSGVSAQSDIVNSAQRIRYVIITSEGNLVSNISVYLRDADGNTFKVSTVQDKNELTGILNSLKDYVTPSNRFSFFIGADRAASQMGEVLFAPYLLLTETEMQLPVISAQNPMSVNDDVGMSATYTEELLRLFSMNPKTAKKYTDANENIIFLQNQSTLRISPDGYIEYTATAGQNGFKLSDAQTTDTATHTRSGVELVYNVYNIFAEQTPQLYISDFATNDAKIEFSLDYNFGGTKVLADQNTHASTVELSNGHVQKFTLHLRQYTESEMQVSLPSSYAAVDMIFADMAPDATNTMIENMFIAYPDNGANAQIRPVWFVKLENENELRTTEQE